MNEELEPPPRQPDSLAAPPISDAPYGFVGMRKKHIVLVERLTGVKFCAAGNDATNRCAAKVEPGGDESAFANHGHCAYNGSYTMFAPNGAQINWREVCHNPPETTTRR